MSSFDTSFVQKSFDKYVYNKTKEEIAQNNKPDTMDVKPGEDKPNTMDVKPGEKNTEVLNNSSESENKINPHLLKNSNSEKEIKPVSLDFTKNFKRDFKNEEVEMLKKMRENVS